MMARWQKSSGTWDAYFFALASLARARRSCLTRAIALANDRLTSPSLRSSQ
jgi:deoxycytidylate deaminase